MRLNHNDIKNILPEFRRGSLSIELENKIHAHLELCEDCRNELSLIAVLGKADVPDPGDPFWKALVQRLKTVAEETEPRLGTGEAFLNIKWKPGTLLIRLVPVAVIIGIIVLLSIRYIGNRISGPNQGIVIQGNASVHLNGYTDPFMASIIDYSSIKESAIPSPIQQLQMDKLYPELKYRTGSYYAEFASLTTGDLENLNKILKKQGKKGEKRRMI